MRLPSGAPVPGRKLLFDPADLRAAPLAATTAGRGERVEPDATVMTSTIRPYGAGAHPRMVESDRGHSRTAVPSLLPATREVAGQQEAGPTVRPGEWWPRTVWGDPWLYKVPQMAAGG